MVTVLFFLLDIKEQDMRAVIYARCSSSGAQESRQDTTRQVADLTRYCNGMSYDIVKVYEEHLTASNGTNRPVLNECVEFSKYNDIDIIVVSELSRINRGSVFDTMSFVKGLMDSNINLYTQKEQFTLLDADGKPSVFAPILLSCLSLANSLELESIKFRLNSGREQAKKRGVKMGRKPGSIMTIEKKQEKYAELIRALKRGLSVRVAAKVCDVSISTVQRIKKEFRL
jgi:DNA invertase Pin-like site-specific DNA recombinase